MTIPELLAREFVSGFSAVPWPVALLRMLAALVLGGVIGWEREIHEKSAGLRTHMIIALAACLFTLIAHELADFRAAAGDTLRVDPLRLIQAVTAGVAFLAAGTIIVHGSHVRGLTTGAGMWLAGAIGLAVGLGSLGLACMATALAVIVLWIVRLVEAHRTKE